MYRIKIYTPGRTKAKFIREGIAHYLKIIRPFAKIEIFELKEGHGSVERVIEEESKIIVSTVKDEFILLHRDGLMLDSLQFAELFKNKSIQNFVIGGVYGVNQTVYDSAKMLISLSKLTFTHELSRLLLLEQIYRAMTIIHGKRYHY